MNRLLLRQQFFSVTHDPAVPVSTFIDDIFSIVRKLDAIGHKPTDLEVSDEILLGLRERGEGRREHDCVNRDHQREGREAAQALEDHGATIRPRMGRGQPDTA